MIILVTGGARSGKSRFAEQLASRLAEEHSAAGYYIATAEAGDEEMSSRIAQHARRREQFMPRWTTIEEPYEISHTLLEIGQRATGCQSVVLLDCLTLWLSNWLIRLERDDDAQSQIDDRMNDALRAAAEIAGYVILVTNEVGDGLVPEYPLGRKYRDLAGWMNQRAAAAADKIFLVTAGVPVELKALQYVYKPEDWT